MRMLSLCQVSRDRASTLPELALTPSLSTTRPPVSRRCPCSQMTRRRRSEGGCLRVGPPPPRHRAARRGRGALVFRSLRFCSCSRGCGMNTIPRGLLPVVVPLGYFRLVYFLRAGSWDSMCLARASLGFRRPLLVRMFTVYLPGRICQKAFIRRIYHASAGRGTASPKSGSGHWQTHRTSRTARCW
jgi:hypothetical protein